MSGPNAATRSARKRRILDLLDALAPALQSHGLPFGLGGRRLVAPPWSVTLRATQPDVLQISIGTRQFLVAEVEGDAVRVRHFARGSWDADLLGVLPARPAGR
jgi:hypothetical protein